jgi:hypothetical protein
MNEPALLYALSTIAQCAAALAALIGFLGLWRLDRLRDIMREDEDEMIAAVLQIIKRAGDLIPIRGRAYFLRTARELVQGLGSAPSPWVIEREGITIRASEKQIIEATLKPTLRRYDALSNEQQRLIWSLRVFLVVTLVVILAPAIVGLVFVGELSAWAWTPWLIGVASALLAIAPTIVVLWPARREA